MKVIYTIYKCSKIIVAYLYSMFCTIHNLAACHSIGYSSYIPLSNNYSNYRAYSLVLWVA